MSSCHSLNFCINEFASADSIVKPELALMQNLAQLGILTNLPSRAISLEQYAPKDLGGEEVPEEVNSDEEELEDKVVPPEFQEDILNSEKALENGIIDFSLHYRHQITVPLFLIHI